MIRKEESDSHSSGYWSNRNKLPVELVPKSSIKDEHRRSRGLQRGRKKKGKGRSQSEDPLVYRKKVIDINFDEPGPDPSDTEPSNQQLLVKSIDQRMSKTIGNSQVERDNREKSYLIQRLNRVLVETNPVKLVDYLRGKIGDKNDGYINALSVILPYEDFPLMQKVGSTCIYLGKLPFYIWLSCSKNMLRTFSDQIQ